MWIIAVSLCSLISLIVVVALCSCWKRQRQKEDWLGLAGMVKQTNPDENVNHIPLSSSNATISLQYAAPDCTPEIVMSVAGPMHCDAASKRPSVQTNTRRSLPDIPSETVQHLEGRVERWEPNGDNSSELYATVEPYSNVGKRHTLPNGLDARASVSQHSSISQADDAPYASVNYDKMPQLEHPYAIVKAPPNQSEPETPADSTRASLSNADGSICSESPSAATVTAGLSRRNSSHSIQVDINVASAVAGGVAASQDLPYMTPPIHAVNQQVNFSGDSQDSSKGYTSISVREPLAHIIAQTKEMNKTKVTPDPHYSVDSDDSDEVYTTIPDALNQEYTSESETYAQIQPVALTVAAEINPVPSNLQMLALVEQIPPNTTDETVRQPPSVNSLRNVTGSHSRQDEELFAASSTNAILNVGSPKPEKRQANSPLPPPPMTTSPSLFALSDHSWKNLDDMYAKVQKNRKKSSDEFHTSHKRTSSSSTSSSEEKKLLADEFPQNCEHNYETLKKSPTKISPTDAHGYEKLIPKNLSEPGYASINGPDSLSYEDPNYEQLKDNGSMRNQNEYLVSSQQEEKELAYSVVNKVKKPAEEPDYISMPNDNDPNYESVTQIPKYESDKCLDVNYERLQATDEDTDSTDMRTQSVHKDGYELIDSTMNCTTTSNTNSHKSGKSPPYEMLIVGETKNDSDSTRIISVEKKQKLLGKNANDCESITNDFHDDDAIFEV